MWMGAHVFDSFARLTCDDLLLLATSFTFQGVVVGTMPKADCIKKLEVERKALGGDDRSKVGLMDSRTSQKVGALQRQIEALKK